MSIGEASPTVALTLATQNPVVGEPLTFDVNVSAPDQNSSLPAPTGSVEISDGSNSCRASVSGSLGVSTGSCEITEGSAGTRSLSATYSGDSNFESAQTGEPLELTIGKASPTIALTLGTQNPVVGQAFHPQRQGFRALPEQRDAGSDGFGQHHRRLQLLCCIHRRDPRGFYRLLRHH